MCAQTTDIKTGKTNVVTVAEKEILYDTGSDELIIVNPSSLGILKSEIDKFDFFKKYMQNLIPTEKTNEKDRSAEIKAIFHWMKEYADAKNEKDEKDILHNLDLKIKEKKGEILYKKNREGETTANANQLKEGDIKELLWFKEKKMVRIRSQKMKNHWRTFNRKQVEKQVNKEIEDQKKESEKQKGPIKEVEIKLFEKKLYSKDGYLFKCAEEFSNDCNFNFFKDSDTLEAGIGAQFLRYATEAKYGAKIDWKNERTLQVSGKAEGSFALAQAKGDFKINIPDKDGLDIIQIIRDINDDFVKNDAKPIYLLILLKLEGSAFLGVCASIGLEAGVSLKNPTSKKGEPAKAEAGLELFAGAKAGAEAQISANMKLIDDVNTNPKAVDWIELGSITYGLWDAVGIGVEVKIKVGYIEGKFRFVAKIGVVLKAGAGTYIKGSIDPINIARLIWTIGTSLEWKNMSDVLEGKVHDLYQCIMLNCLYTGEKIEQVVTALIDDIESLMESSSEAIEKGLGSLKSIDDTFDQYIPGYSGFKNFHAGFWILKAAYYSIKTINQNRQIRENTIDLVNKIDKESRWKYATWQIKVNLIKDMATGESGIGGFTGEDKENAIIKVLESSRHSYEFNRILDGLKSLNVNIDKELDFSQQDHFNQLKDKFK